MGPSVRPAVSARRCAFCAAERFFCSAAVAAAAAAADDALPLSCLCVVWVGGVCDAATSERVRVAAAAPQQNAPRPHLGVAAVGHADWPEAVAQAGDLPQHVLEQRRRRLLLCLCRALGGGAHAQEEGSAMGQCWGAQRASDDAGARGGGGAQALRLHLVCVSAREALRCSTTRVCVCLRCRFSSAEEFGGARTNGLHACVSLKRCCCYVCRDESVWAPKRALQSMAAESELSATSLKRSQKIAVSAMRCSIGIN